MILLRKGRIVADGSMGDPCRHLGAGEEMHIRFRGEINQRLMAEISVNHEVRSFASSDLVVAGNGVNTGTLVRFLVENGIDVERVQDREFSLEDICMAIVKQDEET